MLRFHFICLERVILILPELEWGDVTEYFLIKAAKELANCKLLDIEQQCGCENQLNKRHGEESKRAIPDSDRRVFYEK
jgi:hypothetical protein